MVTYSSHSVPSTSAASAPESDFEAFFEASWLFRGDVVVVDFLVRVISIDRTNKINRKHKIYIYKVVICGALGALGALGCTTFRHDSPLFVLYLCPPPPFSFSPKRLVTFPMICYFRYFWYFCNFRYFRYICAPFFFPPKRFVTFAMICYFRYFWYFCNFRYFRYICAPFFFPPKRFVTFAMI